MVCLDEGIVRIDLPGTAVSAEGAGRSIERLDVSLRDVKATYLIVEAFEPPCLESPEIASRILNQPWDGHRRSGEAAGMARGVRLRFMPLEAMWTPPRHDPERGAGTAGQEVGVDAMSALLHGDVMPIDHRRGSTHGGAITLR